MKTIRRRRREQKTDYKARLALLKSENPRIVVRRTNRYVIAQIIGSEIAQDKVLVGITSKVLISKGLSEKDSGSLKSLPACYLTGYLLGLEAQKKGIKSANLDLGLQRNIHKSRLYAVLKGALDSGLDIPHKEDALPSNEQVEADKFSSVSKKIIK
tara:strand:- start:3964 stop:4431 length:468 start_codon:yes stop_codon:yes gene_type:complete